MKYIPGLPGLNQAGDAWDRDNIYHLPHVIPLLSVSCCDSNVLMKLRNSKKQKTHRQTNPW